MSKSRLRMPGLTIAALLGLGMAAAASAQNSQQMMMQHCNAEASSRHLMGSDRMDFMRTCLSGKRHLALNSQQRRMMSCNARAKAKRLTGYDRKRFMSSCLRHR